MAELNIRERQVKNSKQRPITILDCDGRVTIGEGSIAIRTAIRRLLEEGKKDIIINLSGVTYTDSSGIGELVSSYTAVGREGGNLKLLHLTQKLQDLLIISKIMAVFDVYDDEREAIESYN